VARVGDQVIDGSVDRRLKLMQQQLLTGVATASIDLFEAVGKQGPEPSSDGSQPAYRQQS
jgi:hypothetical protein